MIADRALTRVLERALEILSYVPPEESQGKQKVNLYNTMPQLISMAGWLGGQFTDASRSKRASSFLLHDEISLGYYQRGATANVHVQATISRTKPLTSERPLVNEAISMKCAVARDGIECLASRLQSHNNSPNFRRKSFFILLWFVV